MAQVEVRSAMQEMAQRKARQAARKFERTRMSNCVEERRLRTRLGILHNQHVLNMLSIRQETTELKAELRLNRFRSLKDKADERIKAKKRRQEASRAANAADAAAEPRLANELSDSEPDNDAENEVRNTVVTFRFPEPSAADMRALNADERPAPVLNGEERPAARFVQPRRSESSIGFPSIPPAPEPGRFSSQSERAHPSRAVSKSAVERQLRPFVSRERIHNINCPNKHYKQLKENENRMEENKKPIENRLFSRPTTSSAKRRSEPTATEASSDASAEKSTFDELLRFRAALERKQFTSLVDSVSKFAGHTKIPTHIRPPSRQSGIQQNPLWDYMEQQRKSAPAKKSERLLSDRARPQPFRKLPPPPHLPMYD